MEASRAEVPAVRRTRGRRPVDTSTPIWTDADLCAFFKVSPRTSHRWRSRKTRRIPFVVVGGEIRYVRVKVLAWAGIDLMEGG